MSLGFIGIIQMDHLNSESERILDKRWKVLETSFEAIGFSYENNRIIMEIFLMDKPSEINNLLTQREKNTKQIIKFLNGIEFSLDSQEEKALVRAIQDVRQPYVDSYVRALDVLLKDKNSAQARKQLIEEALPQLEHYQEAWKTFVDFEQRLTAENSRAFSRDFKVKNEAFLVLIILAVGISAGIAFIVIRGMNREIKNRQMAEDALRESGEKLEDRVRERTSELVATNRALEMEIAERKKMQDELALEQKRYQEIFDGSPEGISQTRVDGHLMGANPALAKMFGYDSPEEMMALVKDVREQIYANPSDRDAFRKRIENEPIVRNFEFEFKRKNGTRGWACFTACKISTGGGGDPSILVFMRDVTSEKKAQQERALMEMHLHNAQKLESVGQLAAGIAHEINTPIQYVGDNLRFLEDAFENVNKMATVCETMAAGIREGAAAGGMILEELKKAREDADFDYLKTEIPAAIRQSLDGVQRVANIVGAMKEFSHPGSREKVLVDINRAIQTTLTVARNEWKYVADTRTELAVGLPPVPCLPDELNQVFLNLIINAAQAISEKVNKSNGKEKGLITITSRQIGNWVEIRIADTGPGIPDEIKHRIFEPFFTTKEVGKGTGQGLAISRASIVKKHGGDLTFESVLGHGATFIVRLPIQTTGDKTENQS